MIQGIPDTLMQGIPETIDKCLPQGLPERGRRKLEAVGLCTGFYSGMTMPLCLLFFSLKISLDETPVQSSKLLLGFASIVVLGFGPRRDPSTYFFFQTFMCF
jgi:hypothetical protein